MKPEFIIVFIGGLIFLSHLFVTVFQKTRVPDVLWLILIGFVLGPILGFVTLDDFGRVGDVLTKITLVVILFEGGLELRLMQLKDSLGKAMLLTFSIYLLTAVGLWGLVSILNPGMSSLSALFVSTVLAGPAPSVVIPLLKHIKTEESTRTILNLESTLGEAFCILISLAIFGLMQSNQSLNSATISNFLGGLAVSFVFAALLGFAGGYLWATILDRVRLLQNSMITTPAFLFIIYGISEALSFSGPIAVLCFGIMMGNVEFISRFVLRREVGAKLEGHNEIEIKFFSEIVFLLKIFFFVYLGLAIQISDFYSLFVGLILCLVILLARFVLIQGFRKPLGLNGGDGWTSTVMIPRGLAAAILASYPASYAIAEGESIRSIINYSIFISILMTSALIFVSGRKHKPELEKENAPEAPQEA